MDSGYIILLISNIIFLILYLDVRFKYNSYVREAKYLYYKILKEFDSIKDIQSDQNVVYARILKMFNVFIKKDVR